MRIRQIECQLLHVPLSRPRASALEAASGRLNHIVVLLTHVHTDTGLTGLGLAYALQSSGRALLATAIDDLAPLLVGEDARDHERLAAKVKQILARAKMKRIVPANLYVGGRIPLAGVAHQCGTLRFGVVPKTSVLDPNCRAHELDNLYVVDGSFFPSSAAVNPALTIMANALRVGAHLKERLS